MDPNTGFPLDTLLPETIEWLSTLNIHYTKLSEILGTKSLENLNNVDPNTVEVELPERVQKAIELAIERANKNAVSNAAKVQYFTVLPHDLSFATGELGMYCLK